MITHPTALWQDQCPNAPQPPSQTEKARKIQKGGCQPAVWKDQCIRFNLPESQHVQFKQLAKTLRKPYDFSMSLKSEFFHFVFACSQSSSDYVCRSISGLPWMPCSLTGVWLKSLGQRRLLRNGPALQRR